MQLFAKNVLIDFGIKVVVIMALIMLAAIATPYLAKIIDKNKKPVPEKDENKDNPEEDGVKGVFEKSKLDDFDPNYKIYNTDIYGVEKKNGKKQ